MKNAVVSIITNLDGLILKNYVSLFKEKNSLITFLFHGLFNDKNEIALNHVLPQQAITTDIFRHFVEYYLKHDYLFISPQDILCGLETDKKYVLITFDDGYYNNHLALPILQEYQVPAVFFISPGHIAQNKCFWWDVIHREGLKRGTSIEKVEKEILTLKQKKNADIEQYIKDNFGVNALCPISDIDRPFTPSELNEFSKKQFVFLGNHTNNHAILTNYSLSEIKTEIVDAQKSILNFTGIEPIIIAYPNGNFSSDILPIIKECGIKLGITVVELKNYFPINLKGNDAFLLNRFILWGNKNVDVQCASFRSDIQLLNKVKKYVKQRRYVKERRNENSMPY
jgi:peptidoglycan/xylan/chitin deacetylase (PgdA/CDA1 family)